MAIDPSPSRRAVASDLPPDENVVPTYRAIAPAAIFSLVLGLASILTFVWPYFAGLGALAILSGILALRAIKRLPDALTGEAMANAGIALGLMFSLAALTIDGIQSWQIRRSAWAFARQYAEAVRAGSLDRMLYYQANPEARKDKTPLEVASETKKSMSRPGEFQMGTAELQSMINRITSTPGQTVEVVRLDRVQIVGMNPYADFILAFRGPKSQDFPAEEQLASLQVVGLVEGRGYAWRVSSTKFPLPPRPGGY